MPIENINNPIENNLLIEDNTKKAILQSAEIILENNIANLSENNIIKNSIENNVEKNIKIEYEKMYEKKKVEPVKSSINLNNQFFKNIKNTKFLKTRGGNKDMSSFYKKKYEQNSANYQSISEKQDKDDEISILTDITENSNKIIKNKIVIDGGNSSDEEEDEIDLE